MFKNKFNIFNIFKTGLCINIMNNINNDKKKIKNIINQNSSDNKLINDENEILNNLETMNLNKMTDTKFQNELKKIEDLFDQLINEDLNN